MKVGPRLGCGTENPNAALSGAKINSIVCEKVLRSCRSISKLSRYGGAEGEHGTRVHCSEISTSRAGQRNVIGS